MIRVEELVADVKKKHPDYYGGMDDTDVYENLREKRPDLEWPEINPYEERADLNLNNSNDILDARRVKDEDQSPGAFNNLLLAGLPEIWADKHDWADRSYNNSMAGLIHQVKEGKPKYEVDEYSSGVLEDVGGFFVGLVSVPDIALFFGSGGVGKLAASGVTAGAAKMAGNKTVQKLFQKGVGEGAARKIRNNAFRGKLIAQGAMDSGFSLGTYGAAGGGLAEAARQRTEGAEDLDWGKITGEATKAGISGAIICAASGGVA